MSIGIDRTSRRADGFTLVELLVVIAVIGVLIGTLLPALGGARDRANELRDANALRQLVLAYDLYAQEHGDALIVGYYSANPSGRVVDSTSTPVTSPQARQRYTWRLFSYMDDVDVRGTLISGAQESLLDGVPEPGTPEHATWQYVVSVYPSFGVNAHFLGGYKVQPYRPGDPRYVPGADDTPFNVTKKLSRIVRPHQMVAFGSSRGEYFDTSGSSFVEGWYLVESPQWGELGPFGGGVPGPWSASPYDRDAHPELYGNLDARYSSKAAVGMTDGHVEFLTAEELRDMTRWSDDAARAGDPDWSPAETR